MVADKARVRMHQSAVSTNEANNFVQCSVKIGEDVLRLEWVVALEVVVDLSQFLQAIVSG